MANKPCTPKGQPVKVELPDTRRKDEQLAAMAKALGHPVRVRILRILASRDVCICGDLVDELPIAQSTVSQHLKILKEAGLIQGQIDGPRGCYCINRPALEKLKELVADL